MIIYALIFSLLDCPSPLRTGRSYRGTRFSFDTSIPSRIMANSLARNSTVRAPSRGRGSLNLPSSKRLYHNTNPSRSQYRIFNRSPRREWNTNQCPLSGSSPRSEEHTSELQHGYISYAVFCLKKKKTYNTGYAD